MAGGGWRGADRGRWRRDKREGEERQVSQESERRAKKQRQRKAVGGSGRQDVPTVFPDLVLGTIVPSTKSGKTAGP